MNTDNGALSFEADINMQKLIASINLADAKIRGFTNLVVAEGKKTESVFSQIGPLVGAYFGVEALKGFAGQLVRVRGEFQKYEAVLTNTFGSNEKAKDSMAMLTDIASKTPFQLDAITDSYIKLVNQGFEPTRGEIIKMGDLASSTGKGFDQLVEAILDAQNGEYERLKEFGIKASVEGDKVKMTFKGQTTEIEKGAEAMRAYILSLGGMEGVAGSMSAISGTLVGQISNLEDAWSQMLNGIGEETEGVISSMIKGATYAVQHYQDIVDALAPVIATLGAYKAALISVNAIKGFGDKLKYTAESQELEKLLTVEQRANISKLGLSATSKEYNNVIKEEIAAEKMRQSQIVENSKLEVAMATTKLESRRAELAAAQENVAIKNSEMLAIISAGKAKALETAEQKLLNAEMAVESSIAQRNSANDRLANAVNIGNAKKIERAETALLNAEKSVENAISQKSLAQKELEIVASSSVINSKKVEKAEQAVLNAELSAQSIVLERNVAVRELETRQAALSVAMKKADTLQTGINTVAQNVNSKSTNFLTLAKLKLASAAKSIDSALQANGWGIAIAAVGVLGYAIYTLATQTTAAEVAQKHFTDAMDEANTKINEETSTVTGLVEVINDENNSREYRNQKLQELIALNPEMLQGLTLENLKTQEGKTAIDAYVLSLEKKIKMQALESELTESIKRKQQAREGKGGAETSWWQNAKAIFSSGGDVTATAKNMAGYTNDNAKEIIAAETDLQNKIKQKISDMTSDDSGKKLAEVVINAGYWEKEVKTAKEELEKLDTNAGNFVTRQKILLGVISRGEAELDKIRGGGKANKTAEKQENDAQKKELDAYKSSLESELRAASDVVEQLAIVDKKKNALLTDNTEVGKEKKKIVAEKEEDVNQKAKDQTKELLDTYSSYYASLQLEREYNSDNALLQMQMDKATIDAEKDALKSAMSKRTDKYEKDKKELNKSDYDKLLEDYKTYKQREDAINSEYTKKQALAMSEGNSELYRKLEEERINAIAKVEEEAITASPDWSSLFNGLDKLAISEIIKLRDTLENEISNANVTPEIAEKLKAELGRATDMVRQRNPFAALSDAIKKFKEEGGSKENWENMGNSIGAVLDAVVQATDAVMQSLESLGVEISDVTKSTVSAVSGLASGAAKLAAGDYIGGTIAVVTSAAQLIGNAISSGDRRRDKSIQRHQAAVNSLKTSYDDLQRSVEKALGGDYYKLQQQSIRNLQKQQQEYLSMAESEADKKKSDSGKIDEYKNAAKDAERAIQDIMKEMSDDILQTTATDFADKLGDALAEAFGKGEDAAKAFGDTVNDIMKDAVLNQLKKTFLEKQLQGALDELSSDMGTWKKGLSDSDPEVLALQEKLEAAKKKLEAVGDVGGRALARKEVATIEQQIKDLYNNATDTFEFDGLSEEEQAKFKENVQGIGAGFQEALKVYDDLFKETDGTQAGDAASLSGAIKGMSEETASILSGYINAIRINQVESANIMKNQLMSLNQIAANTKYNVNLVEILSEIKKLNTSTTRAQGI